MLDLSSAIQNTEQYRVRSCLLVVFLQQRIATAAAASAAMLVDGRHDGPIVANERNRRWCSDGFEIIAIFGGETNRRRESSAIPHATSAYVDLDAVWDDKEAYGFAAANDID